MTLPSVYRFLSPYAKSRKDVPRDLLVHQATQNRDFFTTVSRYTLDVCKKQQGHRTLILFWGLLTTQALAARLDRERTGWRGKQLVSDQATLRLFAPILGEAIAVNSIPDLQVSAYMATITYAKKGDLQDSALSAFMEQIVATWSQHTVGPGIQCLAILAQQRSPKQLPKRVAKALLKIADLPRVLVQVKQTLEVDRLANGICLSLIERLAKSRDISSLSAIDAILQSGLLKPAQTSVIFKALLVEAHQYSNASDASGEAKKSLGSILTRLSQAPGDLGDIIQKTLSDAEFDMDQLEMELSMVLRRSQKHLDSPAQPESQNNPSSVSEGLTSEARLRSLLEKLSSTKFRPSSCLVGSSTNTVFDDACEVFLILAAESQNMSQLDGLALMAQEGASEDPFYISFYMRIWCGPHPVLARVAAIEIVKRWLKSQQGSSRDFQALIPYTIAALGDPSKKVRRASADLFAVLGGKYDGKTTFDGVWGAESLYGQTQLIASSSFSASDCAKLASRIIESLEECILRADHIQVVIKGCLENSKRSETPERRGFSQSLRLATLSFLSSHAIRSPMLSFKSRILGALNQVRGVSNTSRTSLLLPILEWWIALSPHEATQLAELEQLGESDLNAAFVGITVPNEKSGLDVLFRVLKRNPTDEREDLVKTVFSHIKKLWPSMKAEIQWHTAKTMMNLSFGDDMTSNQVVGEAMHLLRHVELSSQILGSFLEENPAEPLPRKARRLSSSSSGSKPSVEIEQNMHDIVSKITFVLELVEGSNPRQHPELLDILFGKLSELHHYKTLIGSELGYLQNIVLKSLLAMIPAYEEDKSLKIRGSHGHGDVLVHCIRESSSPSVQKSALLLVAALATTAPEVVLHSVMPIFAFMGTSVLRQSDDYSTHVISQTIKSVIPPLIESLRKQRKDAVMGTAELLSNFVTAYEHIPSHRKSVLFHALIDTLGPDEFTFAIAAMLVDKYGGTDDVVVFAADILGSYSVGIQLHAVAQFLDLLADLFKPKPILSATLFSMDDGKRRQPMEVASSQLSLLPRLLSGRKLRNEVAAVLGKDDMESAKIRDFYTAILESILLLADVVKTDKTLYIRCGDALSNHLNILSTGEFIKAVENLLERPNIVLRQRVLRALEVRVDKESRVDTRSRDALLAFLPTLIAVIRDSEDIHYKHTAVACVDKIAGKYGKKDIETVTAAANTIAGDDCLGQSDVRLRNMALLCLASVVDVLQDAAISVLPAAIPKAIQCIERSLEGPSPKYALHNAAYHFFTSLAQNLPYMMTGKYLERILQVSLCSAGRELDKECDETRKVCLELLARQVDAKAMFMAMQHVWDRTAGAELEVRDSPTVASSILITNTAKAIREYLQILGIALDRHPKPAISRNLGHLSVIFIGCLDLGRGERTREKQDETGVKINDVEDVVNEVALKMIYKLTDATFRPLFSQLIDWSTELEKSNVIGHFARLRSLYGFLFVFFGNIKSAATHYATYVIDNAVKILTEAKIKDETQADLWRRVLKTLTKCFEHDSSDFWQAPSHFAAVFPALTSQFEKATDIDLEADLVPAIVELAGAADSLDHHKELNMAILKHLRSESSDVRLAAVMCQQALVERHTEDWLQSLPEMLPFISELQEDSNDVVERGTHRWITKIEKVLGENLDAMLR